jgi:sugar transferase (PEP-CTERM/EpsH1 system associated)
MKILYLAHRIPYPPNKGDKIRSFNEIKYLSQRHEIHLACLADDPKDLKYENDLKKFCKTTNVILINPRLAKLKSTIRLFSTKPLSVSYFYSRKLQHTIDHLLSANDFDAVFCFSSPMAEYVFKSRLPVSSCLKLEKSLMKGFPVTRYEQRETSNQHPATSLQKPATSNHQPRLIMDFVDVDSDKWAQYGRYASFPKSWIYRLESKRLSKYERKVAEVFQHSIFVTDSEVKIFRDQNPYIKNITSIPNGVDLDYFSPTFSQEQTTRNQPPAPSNEQPVIVFTGAMGYYANVEGVVWFTKEILPLIRKEIPEIQFYIVGSNPKKEVLSLSSNNGVTVTGYVPDIREYLNKATLVVVPLRIARGIQNKILEAMAMGIPVVATPQAFEGIKAKPGRDLILGEDVERIAEGVIGLIKKVSLRKSLVDNARSIIEKNYCWVKNLEKLDNILIR